MGKKEKLEARLLSRPTDMTFEEMATLLGFYGYLKVGQGKRVDLGFALKMRQKQWLSLFTNLITQVPLNDMLSTV